MKYCPICASPVALSIPPGDNRERHCCAQCNAVHYQNPKMVIGTIPMLGDRVLLCKRAIEPRYGFWTLPAGFMENGETTAEGACRETLEEAGARVELLAPFSIIDVPHVDQIHMFFVARMLHDDFIPGPESLEAKLFTEAQIPWDDLAFRTVSQTLRWFFEDRSARGASSLTEADQVRLHTSSIRHGRSA